MKVRNITIGILSIVFIIAIVNIIIKKKKANELLSDRTLTSGYITSYYLRPKSGATLDVSFVFNKDGKPYRSSTVVYGIYPRDFNNFLNKTFPVIYSNKKPFLNEILITPDKFEKYKFHFPDSLNWIYKYWTKDYISND